MIHRYGNRCLAPLFEYEGIPATGNEIEVAAIHLATIVNGKVKEWWAVEDYLGQYQQLGMELRPAAVEE